MPVQCTSAATRVFTGLYSDTALQYGLFIQIHHRGRLSRSFSLILSPLPQRTRSLRASLSYATKAPCPYQVGVLSLRVRLRKLSLHANTPISVTQRSHKSSCLEMMVTIQFQRYAEPSVVGIATAKLASLFRPT